MKPKLNEKPNHETDDFPDDDFMDISWEDSLGKEVRLFWESIYDEFE
jgi:hypothetical protein